MLPLVIFRCHLLLPVTAKVGMLRFMIQSLTHYFLFSCFVSFDNYCNSYVLVFTFYDGHAATLFHLQPVGIYLWINSSWILLFVYNLHNNFMLTLVHLHAFVLILMSFV